MGFGTFAIVFILVLLAVATVRLLSNNRQPLHENIFPLNKIEIEEGDEESDGIVGPPEGINPRQVLVNIL